MKRYKVVGTQRVLEHDPGEIFEKAIPADLEAFLLRIGALRVLEAQKPEANKNAFKR